MIVWAVSVNHLFHQNKVYHEYNNMKGIVIDFSNFKTCNIATIKLQNGLIGEVNVGGENYKLGDQWINKLKYHPLTGIYGYAYFIIPNEISEIILSLLALTFNLLFIGSFCIMIIIKMIIMWNEYSERLIEKIDNDKRK